MLALTPALSSALGHVAHALGNNLFSSALYAVLGWLAGG